MFTDDLGVQVIGLFCPNYMDVLSINEIASRLGKKYPYVHKRVKGMISDGLLKVTLMGRSHLCSLDLSHPMVAYLLGFHHLQHARKRFRHSSLLAMGSDIIERLPSTQALVAGGTRLKNTTIYAVGSHGDGNFKHQGSQVLSITWDEMSRMLLDTSSSFYADHIVILGFDHLFRMIRANERELKLAYNPLVGKIL